MPEHLIGLTVESVEVIQKNGRLPETWRITFTNGQFTDLVPVVKACNAIQDAMTQAGSLENVYD